MKNGEFMNIYLSPRDYHRVHMPWAGTLDRNPACAWPSVQRVAVHGGNDVPRLFARNERLVCHFDTDFGPMCSVMVGAMLVSGVETVWNGVNIPKYANAAEKTRLPRYATSRLDRFAEMARFNYGSTVILLFPERRRKTGRIRASGAYRTRQAHGSLPELIYGLPATAGGQASGALLTSR